MSEKAESREWKEVIHNRGAKACGKISFYLAAGLVKHQVLSAKLAKHLNGSSFIECEVLQCESCGAGALVSGIRIKDDGGYELSA